jgi:putative ABC transport system permease protein
MSAVIDAADEEVVVMRRLKQQFQERHILLDAYTTIARQDQSRFSRNQFRPVLGTLMGLSVMIAAVGGIGLSGTLGIGVLQRTREIGVLRAIGAPSSAIRRLLVLEGLLHGVMAWLISLPLGYLCAEPMAKELGLLMFGIQLDYRFNAAAAGYWLVMLIFIAWVASSWPARKAARLSIKESFGF